MKKFHFEERFGERKEQSEMIRIELLKVGKDTTRGRDFFLYALCPSRFVARELLLKDPRNHTMCISRFTLDKL